MRAGSEKLAKLNAEYLEQISNFEIETKALF